jgi:hypothetical protein
LKDFKLTFDIVGVMLPVSKIIRLKCQILALEIDKHLLLAKGKLFSYVK